MTDTCNQCKALRESFLSDLDMQSRGVIRALGITIHYNKGQDIIKQGHIVEGFFCIRKGQVKLSLETIDGESLTIRLFSNCGVIGAHGIVSSKYICTATCLSDSDICFFPKATLLASIPNYPSIGVRLNQIMMNDYVQLSKVAVSLASRSVLQRVAEALVLLQHVFGIDKTGIIDSQLTKDEIARIAGTSIESVFRTLSDFKKKKYIDFDGRKIRLLNEDRLRSIGKIGWG